MEEYYKLLEDALLNGEVRQDRTGTGTRSLFGRLIRFDLEKGFPLLTGKRVPFKSVVAELVCFLEGKHNVADFQKYNCTIWDEFGLENDAYNEEQVRRDPSSIILEYATKARLTFQEAAQSLERADTDYREGKSETNSLDILEKYKINEFDLNNAKYMDKGELGPIYGVQWNWWQAMGPKGAMTNINQIVETIRLLKEQPFTRRAVVTAWNPSLLPIEGKSHEENVKAGLQALPPCHFAYQFYISKPNTPEAKLNLMYIMRSNDLFLGAPFNIASYALLTHLMANELQIGVGELIAVTGDTHVYSNHISQAKTLLDRWKYQNLPPLPKLKLDPLTKISNLSVNVIVECLEEYSPLEKIAAPVAV